MISEEDFVEVCKSFGLEEHDTIGFISFVLGGASISHHMKTTISTARAGETFVITIEHFRIDDDGRLMMKRFGEYSHKVDTVEQLRNDVELTIQKYREMMKEFRIKQIREL